MLASCIVWLLAWRVDPRPIHGATLDVIVVHDLGARDKPDGAVRLIPDLPQLVGSAVNACIN